MFDLVRQTCSHGDGGSLLGHRVPVSRLFSVGIGHGVSRHLVSGMARAGRGTSRFVEEGSMDLLRIKVLGQLKQAMQPSLDNVSIEWNFPKQETESVIAPAVKPVKTLLGYRSPDLDVPLAPTQPKLYPSVTAPIFNQEKYLSFAMFPRDSIKPASVSVKCDTMDGPLELCLELKEAEVFSGSIARKCPKPPFFLLVLKD